MEYRPFYLAREWTRTGHRVTVAASSFSHLRTHQPELTGGVTREDIDAIQYWWFKTPLYHGNGAARGLNILTFVSRLIQHTCRLVEAIHPDVVVASSTYPLDIVAAQRIAHRSRAGLVFEVHDLWPLSPIELGGMSPWHPFIVLMQWAENRAYRTAHEVVSLLPNAVDHMVAHGLPADRFTCVPNGIDRAEWEGAREPIPPEHNERLIALRRQGRFIVGYAGGHAVSNALGTLLDAAAQMRQAGTDFVLVGNGTEKEALERQASERALAHVHFLPPVPKRAIPNLLTAMDALFLGWKNRPIYRFGVSPNKLFDYMMAGRPIVHACGASNDPVDAYRCGICVPPEDASAVAEAMQRLMRMTIEEREVMGRRGRDYVLRHHTYEVLAPRFAEVLQRAVRAARGDARGDGATKAPIRAGESRLQGAGG